jgi:alanine racemase
MTAQTTRAVIDPDAIAANLRALRSITNPGTRIMAVVKADAYGHGCIRVSETALSNGADCLGVARVEEGMKIRESGISVPILVFGEIPEPVLPDLVKYELTPTAYSLPYARAISQAASRLGKTIPVHVKVDTGMGRLGLLPDNISETSPPDRRAVETAALVLEMSKLPGLHLEGVYTHFAAADSADGRFARAQFDIFRKLLERLENEGLEIPIRHAANSAAIINYPETHLDMVRPGIALYGLYPSREIDRSRISLTPAMSLQTRIIHLKQVPARFPVSYGCTYKTPAPTLVATVPVGYADGYSRLLSNRGHMLVRGMKAPVVGRVCMDLTMLDVGHIPGVSPGDEVMVFGKQGDMPLSADDLADLAGTISYEIVTSISDRIPREYGGRTSGAGRRG